MIRRIPLFFLALLCLRIEATTLDCPSWLAWESASTKDADGTIVPWLASAAPYNFTPESPPRDHALFDYLGLFKDIFAPRFQTGLHYFGVANCHPDFLEWESDPISFFWQHARRKQLTRVLIHHGKQSEREFRAPIAIYQHAGSFGQQYVFMQNGSYQFVSVNEQPEIPQGFVKIYRGIGKEKRIVVPTLPTDPESLNAYLNFLSFSFGNSVIAFAFAHDGVYRGETDIVEAYKSVHIFREYLARTFPDAPPTAKSLRQTFNRLGDSYSLTHHISKHEFGPNVFVGRTPITNLRLVPSYGGETEVRVLDTSKIEPLPESEVEFQFARGR